MILKLRRVRPLPLVQPILSLCFRAETCPIMAGRSYQWLSHHRRPVGIEAWFGIHAYAKHSIVIAPRMIQSRRVLAKCAVSDRFVGSHMLGLGEEEALTTEQRVVAERELAAALVQLEAVMGTDGIDGNNHWGRVFGAVYRTG